MRKDVWLGEQPFCVECEADEAEEKTLESDCRKSWLP